MVIGSVVSIRKSASILGSIEPSINSKATYASDQATEKKSSKLNFHLHFLVAWFWTRASENSSKSQRFENSNKVGMNLEVGEKKPSDEHLITSFLKAKHAWFASRTIIH
jgi:hypothetical protein